MENPILEKLRGGIIVSCQALKEEPLHGSEYMAKMSIAAMQGGAVGIRANSGVDIKAIKDTVDLPVIGIVKKNYPNSEVFITPTIHEVEEVVEAGADIIAVDATHRIRPDGKTSREFIEEIKRNFPNVLLMADISILKEGIDAANYGADLVGTTLSGYTEYSPKKEEPDYILLKQLVKEVEVPVIGEGRIRTPDDAIRCYKHGVWSIVVGAAITRPQEITRWFTDKVRGRVV